MGETPLGPLRPAAMLLCDAPHAGRLVPNLDNIQQQQHSSSSSTSSSRAAHQLAIVLVFASRTCTRPWARSKRNDVLGSSANGEVIQLAHVPTVLSKVDLLHVCISRLGLLRSILPRAASPAPALLSFTLLCLALLPGCRVLSLLVLRFEHDSRMTCFLGNKQKLRRPGSREERNEGLADITSDQDPRREPVSLVNHAA